MNKQITQQDIDKIYSVTPPSLSQVVINFCLKVVPNSKPFYVPTILEDYSKPMECFPNVEKKIKKDGGTAEYGWQIWLWPDNFIEAEFHAVWKSDDGLHIDITPKDIPYDQILFLPDKKKNYDGKCIDNIRYNLTRNKLIDIFIGLAECKFLIMNYGERAYQNYAKFSGDEQDFLRNIVHAQRRIKEMLISGISRNNPCLCGSGEKFKQCCEKDTLKFIEAIKKMYAE